MNNIQNFNSYIAGEVKKQLEFKRDEEILLNSKFFPISTSFSKFICVGVSLNDFSPKIQICSNKGFSIVLDEEEWKSLLKYQGVIVNYFYLPNGDYPPLDIGDLTIIFEKINQYPVLKIQKSNGNYLYFGRETMDHLWEIKELIDYRIQILLKQDFYKYFSVFQTSSNNCVDVLTNVYNVINPSYNLNSENVSTMLEMLIKYPEVLENKLRKSGTKRKYYEEISDYE